MKKTGFLVVLLTLMTVGLFAQDAVISGVVKDIDKKTPLSGVQISLNKGGKGSVTAEDGLFAFTELSPGEYTLRFSLMGYKTVEKTFKLATSAHMELEIFMQNETKWLNPFEVIADRDEPLPYVRSIVSAEMMERDGARDLGDYLRSMPNVSAVRKGGTQLDPVIRGFKFSQLNVQLNNGHYIEGGCPNRMDPTMAHIETEEIQRIEVFKGPYALRYGVSMGGVINLITHQAKPYENFEIHTKAIMGWESNWNGYTQNIAVNGGNKYVFFRLAGGNKDYGHYYAANSQKINSSFNKYYFHGQLGFQPMKNHQMMFSYMSSQGRDVMFAALPMDERMDDTHLYSFDYKAKNLTPVFTSLEAKIYSSKVSHTMDNKNRSFSDTVAAVSFIDPLVIGDRIEAIFEINENSKLYVGQDFHTTTKSGDRTKNMIAQPPTPAGGFPVPVDAIWNNAALSNLGFFSEYNHKLNDWEFMAAARIDFNQASSDSILIKHPMMGVLYEYGADTAETKYTNFSASAAVTRHLSEKFSLSLALGRGVRSPDMTERFIILLPVGFDKFDYLGNPKLKPEINNEVDLTLTYKEEKIGRAEINVFYSLVQDFISAKRLPPSEIKPLTNSVLGVKQFYNAEQANFMGFEIAYSTPQDYKWGLDLAASYTMGTIDEATKHITDSTGAIIDDEVVTDDPISEIPPMELNASLHYKFMKSKLVPLINFRYVADQNRVSEAFSEEATPGFLLLNASLSYKHNDNLRFNTGVQNIFNTLYYEHLNRRMIGTSQKLYEPGRVFYVNVIFTI